MSHFCKLVQASLFAVAALPASAASVLTFDGPFAPLTPYVENGFVVDDDGFYLAADGALHFDIAFGPYNNVRTLERIDGGGFDLHAFDIIPIYPSVEVGGLLGAPMDDIQVEAFDGASLVATATASSQGGDTQAVFGEMFANITSLVITGFDPGNIDYEPLLDVHFLIDNVVVSAPGAEDDPLTPVPLPAAGWLLAAALVGIGMARKVGRR